jgi:hypothetical protein
VLQKRFGGKSEPTCQPLQYQLFQPEGFPDELDLPSEFVFRQPSHLAFPDHVHSFVALNRPPRSIKRSKALAGVHPALDCSMVLLHNIVQIRAGSTAAPAPPFPFLLQLRDHLRVGWVAVHGDHPRAGMTGNLRGFLKESLGRSRVTLGGKPKVDCGTGGIDGTIQISPVPALANIFRRPSRSHWPVSVRAGIFYSVRGRSAAPSAKWWCGQPGDLVPWSIPRRPDTISENRRYQRTAQTMTSGSKCRHLNSTGRGLIMGYTAAYQTRSLSFCNTAVFSDLTPSASCPVSGKIVPCRRAASGPGFVQVNASTSRQ